ncbi:MAG: hypothetical protein JSV24_11990 [Bacteroidales bacterium]|nr:MAG: hypothetical protein JSV24_11990 [Bacteroidales bacterium]
MGTSLPAASLTHACQAGTGRVYQPVDGRQGGLKIRTTPFKDPLSRNRYCHSFKDYPEYLFSLSIKYLLRYYRQAS